MSILLENHLEAVKIPANLRINDQIKKYRKKCADMGCTRPYHHFAFGQSPFSPPQKIIDALRKHADEHDYLPTAGIPELRSVIAEYYREIFQINCSASQVIVSPGSKEMISMIIASLEGSVLIPSPSWVSYLPQAKILKKEVITIKLNKEEHYKITPENLTLSLQKANNKQKILILNNPNNPTGVVYSLQELKEIAAVCKKNNVIVISDEIYARTSFNFDSYVSMALVYPDKTIVTGGLSKDRSAGGYRMGVGIFPDNKALIDDILKIAGSTYSCVSSPVQYASIIAYSRLPVIEKYINDCAQIHSVIGKITASRLNNIKGIHTTIPEGAFYLYVDFNDYKEKLNKLGIKTCTEMCEHLINVEHTALLPGSSLLLPEDNFAVRLSYVDYNGDKVLKKWQRYNFHNDEEKEDFFEKYCPLIVQGINSIERYFNQVAEGKLPEHK